MRNPLVVVNKPGGGGTVAMEYVQNKPADGYTIFCGVLLPVVQNGLTGLTKYQHYDFQGIMLAQRDTMMLHVAPGGKYKSVQDVIADAKARPGEQTWGVVGPAVGLNGLLASEFSDAFGIKVRLVPYDRAGKQQPFSGGT